jgi:hypothetical protein
MGCSGFCRFLLLLCMRSLLITIFEISHYIYKAPHHDIRYVFLETWGSFSNIQNITVCVYWNIEYWSESDFTILEISLHVFWNILLCENWYKLELICVFSSRYLDISLAKKKLQYLQSYIICYLIYILLAVQIWNLKTSWNFNQLVLFLLFKWSWFRALQYNDL